MNRSLLWRGILIVLVVVVAVAASYPLKDKIKLGLDLRGGMHLVLEVHTGDALRAETDRDMEILTSGAQEEGATGLKAQRTSESSFSVSGVTVDNEAAVGKAAKERLPGWTWDRQGDKAVFSMKPDNTQEIRDLAVNQALQTIRNRVDAFGVAEPVIQRLGLSGDRIVVQLPGVDDPERIRRLIKNTAFLEFRLVAYPETGAGASSQKEILAHYGGTLPDDLQIMEHDVKDDQGRVIDHNYFALEKRQVITGRDLKTARPDFDQNRQPIVSFTLTPDGGRRFGEVTGSNVGRFLAIILDGKVVSDPRINSRIGDRGVIEGSFTQQEVDDLSTVLRSGALPAGITYLEERTVGPSLGRDSIRQGLRAGLIGALLVVLTILVVYRLSGINAVLALALNIILIFGCLAYFRATLTLPGIAGIILTIGMAVDANVLVFERIKEELRVGRTVKAAIDSGFGKALSSILDANITTLIAALFLFQFGTGPIRGFAVTLSVGILASIFTAVFVSRWMFDLVLSRRQRVEKLSI